MTTSRQWHDLLLLKRFGFGHDLESKPTNGDLALFCPACPQPGINISEEPAPDHKQCVDILSGLYHRHLLILKLFPGGCTAGALLWMETSLWST